MRAGDSHTPQTHKDSVLFREAVAFTAAQTGFSQRLIEKDYFCTLLLAHLASTDSPPVFKGGTCLAKVYAEFYRMSEDLDFVVPVKTSCSRSERRNHSAGLKQAFSAIIAHEPYLILEQPLRGANQSRQYLGTIGYDSLINEVRDTIKVEVGIREPLVKKPVKGSARTALLDPVSGEAMVPTISIPCISMAESYAEKIRAALTRREVAIRDFYDIDYGVTHLRLHPTSPEMVRLVRKKIAVPGNDAVDVSDARMSSLHRQLTTRLRPVLRGSDFEEFDLDRATNTVLRIAEAVGRS